jgi:hypothetical protein
VVTKPKLVYGAGINDVGYNVTESVELPRNSGKRKRKILSVCPYYRKWVKILERCYSKSYQVKKPTYVGCTVDPEWLYFSNFKKWVDSQPNKDWQNSELDKDLLMTGCKVYSPDSCCFIPQRLNSFLTTSKASRGECLIGVSKYHNKFRACCSDMTGGSINYIGLFKTELEAHKAWQAKKHEYACKLADLQEDSRVADALRQRYAPDKDWTEV